MDSNSNRQLLSQERCLNTWQTWTLIQSKALKHWSCCGDFHTKLTGSVNLSHSLANQNQLMFSSGIIQFKKPWKGWNDACEYATCACISLSSWEFVCLSCNLVLHPVCLFSVPNQRFNMSCLKDRHYIWISKGNLRTTNANYPACRMFDCITVCCGSLLCNDKWITCHLMQTYRRAERQRTFKKRMHMYFIYFFMWPMLQPKGLFEVLHEQEISWWINIYK